MQLTYRHANVDDVVALTALADRFVESTIYATVTPPEGRAQALAALIENVVQLGVIFIAEEAVDGIVGMLAALQVRSTEGGYNYCDELAWFVAPEYRKTGIGLFLMQAMEKWARQQGLYLCKMVAPAGSRIGQLYESLDYTALETAYIKRL